MPYLLKTEPGKYSFDDLVRDGETVWDGISNPQALMTLRNMKKGEHCVIYHSNTGKEAVFQGSILFRQFRLSVVPLTQEQYDWLLS